jgi:hypothetical protein
MIGDHAIAGVCGTCDGDLGDTGRVLLPRDGHSPMRALCGECLQADPEALAAAAVRGIDFVQAFLLALTAAGCRPRSVACAEAAS